jgi:hypothetical protein
LKISDNYHGQEWALASGGCFLLGGRSPDDPARYVRFKLFKDNQEAVQRIKWAQIKSADRAIEKIVRVYEQVKPLHSFVVTKIIAVIV